MVDTDRTPTAPVTGRRLSGVFALPVLLNATGYMFGKGVYFADVSLGITFLLYEWLTRLSR